MSYAEAKKWVRQNWAVVETVTQWKLAIKSEMPLPPKPSNIPSNPAKFYGEFEGWTTFLGQTKAKSSYEEHQNFLRRNYPGASTKEAFEAIADKLPKTFYRNPASAFRKTGEWEGWGAFLGKRSQKNTSQTL